MRRCWLRWPSALCRAVVSLALCLAPGPAVGQSGEALRPAICWRTAPVELLGSRPGIVPPAVSGEGTGSWFEVSVGVGRMGLLAWGDAFGADADGVYRAFEIRGDEPSVFLEGSAEDGLLWINATARGNGVDRLTIRTRRAGTGRCEFGDPGSKDFLEVEAIAVGAGSSCLRWALPAPAENGLAPLEGIFGGQEGSLCFPTTVPDLVGKPLSRAKQLLTEARLTLGEVVERPARGPVDAVLEQRPVAGRNAVLPPRAVVDLVVAGHRFADTPDLLGLSVAEARTALAELELELSARSGGRGFESRDIASYAVVSQRPASGQSVRVGSSVEVEALVAVPSFMGLALSEVIGRSAALGLTVGWSRGVLPESVSGLEDFEVDVQSPLAGQQVAYGGAVEVELLGAVPDLRGLSVVAAADRARARGLLPDASFDSELRRARAGTPARVGSQSPAPGSRAYPGDRVSIRTVVPVPDLRGRSVADANEQLRAYELALDPAAGAPESWASLGVDHRISGQRPEPGSLISRDTSVSIDVEVQVPFLGGKEQGAAASSLERVRLLLGEVGSWPATSRLDTVVTQAPAASTWVGAGSAIDVTLAGVLAPLDPWRIPWFWVMVLLALAAGLWAARPPDKLPRGLEIKGVVDHGSQSFRRDPGEAADVEPGVSFRVHMDAGRQSLVQDDD